MTEPQYLDKETYELQYRQPVKGNDAVLRL